MKKFGTPPRGANGSDSENGLPPPTEPVSPSAGVVVLEELLVLVLVEELPEPELEPVVRLDGCSDRGAPGRGAVVVLDPVVVEEEVVELEPELVV